MTIGIGAIGGFSGVSLNANSFSVSESKASGEAFEMCFESIGNGENLKSDSTRSLGDMGGTGIDLSKALLESWLRQFEEEEENNLANLKQETIKPYAFSMYDDTFRQGVIQI